MTKIKNLILTRSDLFGNLIFGISCLFSISDLVLSIWATGPLG